MSGHGPPGTDRGPELTRTPAADNAPRPDSDGDGRRSLALLEALLPVIAMAVLFATGAAFLGVQQELLLAVLLASAGVAGFVAARQGCSWADIERSTGQKVADVLPMLLILLAIGMLIGSWVLSGTIPYLVHWGVRLVSARYLILTAFLATAAMSLATGTSWGSAGTIGVALMGTAAALDAPSAATAGAVLSGAYLGDKMSPLSDTTNICAIAADAGLYAHIRHMVYTAAPSLVACLLVYTLAAYLSPPETAGAGESANALLADIEDVFTLHWIVLLPPAVVVWGIIRRTPPALAIVLSSVVALMIGIAVQAFGPEDALVAAVAGFQLEMVAGTGVDPGTFGPDFTTLVARGGLYSMASTLIIVLAAFLLAGAMDVSGALDLIIRRMLQAVHSAFGLIAATMAAGATTIGLTSHGGVTALVIGGLFQKAYEDRGLASVNLSRSLEDSVTVTEPLMPWTVSAVFMATTLGVPTLEYAPWAVFCYGGPLFSLLIAGLYRYTGFGLRRLEARPTREPEPTAPPHSAATAGHS